MSNSDFTKKVRLNLKNWGRVLGIREDVRVSTVVRWLKEACKKLDASESINADLLEACKDAYDYVCSSSKLDWDNVLAPKLEAAIAKAEKEG